ncbi:MAG: sigma 54-interacting transcriptional regulator [Deltaproteobacteria bacterium]|jgi:hydrogenase-4 transcriptional activator|nr:sigma 54-interacting transcriptional regulator [Deltaproteobacteria bacterium]
MDHSHDVLRFFLHGVQDSTAATHATLFVPSPSSSRSHTLLVHAGEGQPLPELHSLDTAYSYLDRLDTGDFDQLDIAPGLQGWLGSAHMPVRSHEKFGLIFPLLLGQSPLGLPELDPNTIPPATKWQRRSSDHRQVNLTQIKPPAWFGLTFDSQEKLDQFIEGSQQPTSKELTLHWLFSLGGAMGRHISRVRSVLHDSLTGLPGLSELHQMTAELIREANIGGPPLSLLMLNPTDYGRINDALGQEVADDLLNKMAHVLRGNLRSTDFMARFGGAVFAVLLPDTGESNALIVASRLVEQTEARVNELVEVNLQLHCGMSVYNAKNPRQPELMIQQAAQALGKARLSMNQVELWHPGQLVSTKAIDPLTSVLTGDMTRDYRRMSLMWDTVRTIAANQEPESIIGNSADSLRHTFRAHSLYIFRKEEDESLKLIQRMVSPEMIAKGHYDNANEVLPGEAKLVDRAVEAQAILGCGVEGIDDTQTNLEFRAIAIPMLADDKCHGCIYMSHTGEGHWLDVTDVLFLQGLSTQLAMALDRALLAKQEQRNQEERRKKLRDEFDTLRKAFGKVKLVYNSPAMEELLSSARRVATTEATILITGESGTGKGILAQTIHNLSNRHDRPFVTVDCSSISPNLIENELFGHVRGAYTGAESSSMGRIAEANGGTVFIDEIGELPLEVQGRLLTFVQDHRISPVGATRYQQVDVRIIAATNRDLEREVSSGKFRQDLYYRLNVVTFAIPPLRDRREEIALLTRYYIEQFSLQYQKRIDGLSDEAELAMLSYNWPGNIRELQNKVMRAVILCTENELQLQELDIPLSPAIPVENRQITQAATAEQSPQPPQTVESDSGIAPAMQLRHWLSRDVTACIDSLPSMPPPVALWLTLSFVEAAQTISSDISKREPGSVTRRAAKLLGVPESTYRRRLGEINHGSKDVGRREIWASRSQVLQKLVEANEQTADNLLEGWKGSLLAEVLDRLGNKTKIAASMMNTTEQTLRKWRKEQP